MGPKKGGTGIRRATPADVADIAAVAERCSLPAVGAAEGRHEGFLVSGYSTDEYGRWVDDLDLFLVHEGSVGVDGFLMGASADHVPEAWWIDPYIRHHYGGFAVIKQVAVLPEVRRTGLGAALYTEVLDRAGSAPVVAAVVAEPPNERSVDFHRRMGFFPAHEAVAPDGMGRVHWVRRPVSREWLVDKYAVAVDLYKYEDQLNWFKLNNLLYVTAGLGAVIALFAAADPDVFDDVVSFRAVVVAVAAVGMLSSVVLGAALWSGVRYFQRRKSVALAIERATVEAGSRPVLGDLVGGTEGYLRRSPTEFVLRATPVLLAGLWLVVGLVAAL